MSSHDIGDQAMTDRLLTEIERQQKYLDRLPDDFEFPLFNAKQALESRRRSGYRNIRRKITPVWRELSRA
jgi:hypothetical protein